MGSQRARGLFRVVFLTVLLLPGIAIAGPTVTSVHPDTIVSGATSRVFFAIRNTNNPEQLATGDQIVFVVRSNAPSGSIAITNLGPAVVTSDPVALGLQGTWTSSISGTDTIILTYTAGATNRFNSTDVIAIAADVTPNAAAPNGGSTPDS